MYHRLSPKIVVLAYLLFLFYLVLFSWLVTKSNNFKAAGLPPKLLVGLFIAKVAGGVLYGYIHQRYVADSDTWSIFDWSLKHYKLLLQDPAGFIKAWNADPLTEINHRFSDVFGSEGSFWNNLKSVILMKIEAMVNVFSFGHYYVNVIWYAFLTFGGYIAFYRALLLIYPKSGITSLIAVFFIPSCFFWTSGMLKDGILFMLFGYIFYYMTQWASLDGSGNRNVHGISSPTHAVTNQPYRPYLTLALKITACLAGIFILRNYIVLLLVPCLLAWALSIKFPSKTALWFLGVFSVGLLLFFLSPYILAGIDFPLFLANKRHDFLLLPANSALPAGRIEPSFLGYLAVLPESINYGLFRPYLWDDKGVFYIPFAIELSCFYILLLAYFFQKQVSATSLQRSFFIFGLLFLISNWLLIGFTAPIIGAIIRYKSIFMTLTVAHIFYFLMPGLNKLKK